MNEVRPRFPNAEDDYKGILRLVDVGANANQCDCEHCIAKWKRRREFLQAAYQAYNESLEASYSKQIPKCGPTCGINPFSSRCCEKGTKGCVVEHAKIEYGMVPKGWTPDGWQLVPRIMTKRMRSAFMGTFLGFSCKGIWNALLNASPDYHVGDPPITEDS